MEGFACPNDPGSYVVGGFMPLVGSPKANRFQVKDQTKRGSKTHHIETQQWSPAALAWTRVTGAPPWSQAQGWGSMASAWWPGLFPWGPAGLSPKKQGGTPFQRAHHLQEGSWGSGEV